MYISSLRTLGKPHKVVCCILLITQCENLFSVCLQTMDGYKDYTLHQIIITAHIDPCHAYK